MLETNIKLHVYQVGNSDLYSGQILVTNNTCVRTFMVFHNLKQQAMTESFNHIKITILTKDYIWENNFITTIKLLLQLDLQALYHFLSS